MIKFAVIPKKKKKKKTFGIEQFGKIGQFYHSKLKSKHLVFLSFFWWQVFLREREKIFYTFLWPTKRHFLISGQAANIWLYSMNVKFMFSMKATKIEEIVTVDLTLCAT